MGAAEAVSVKLTILCLQGLRETLELRMGHEMLQAGLSG